MRHERLLGAALLALAVATGTTVLTPAPAGACSLADPCWEVEGAVELGQPTIEAVDAAADALPPEWLDTTGVLRFDGNGDTIAIELDSSTTFTF